MSMLPANWRIKIPLFHSIQKMIAVRKEHSVLGNGNINWLEINNPAIAAYLRQNNDDSLLILSNLSSSFQTIKPQKHYHGIYFDLLGRGVLEINSTTLLQPYSFLWLQKQK